MHKGLKIILISAARATAFIMSYTRFSTSARSLTRNIMTALITDTEKPTMSPYIVRKNTVTIQPVETLVPARLRPL